MALGLHIVREELQGLEDTLQVSSIDWADTNQQEYGQTKTPQKDSALPSGVVGIS